MSGDGTDREHEDVWDISEYPTHRPKTPLPRAPLWLPPAVLGVGVVALFLASFDRPGIGLVITGVVAGLTALTALLVRPAIPEGEAEDETEPAEAEESDAEPADEPAEEMPSHQRYAWSAVYGGLATALLATAALRDAGWVLVWTLLGSFLLASLAFAAHNPAARRNALGVATSSLALLRNIPAVPVFLGRPLARYRASSRVVEPALVTALITGGLLVVFGALFAYADPLFASHIENFVDSASVDLSGLHPFGALFAVLFTGAAVLAARRRPASTLVPTPAPSLVGRSGLETTEEHEETETTEEIEEPDETDRPKATAEPWPTWAWTTPLGSLVVLFVAFLAVQASAMFGGDDYVQRVAGVIYAEYARQGFFQLVVVSLLVLGVVAVTVRLIPGAAPRARDCCGTPCSACCAC